MRWLVGFVVVAGCTSSPPQTPSRSAAPPVDPAMCHRLAKAQHDHCATTETVAYDYCMTLARLAEATSCVAPALRSFDCGIRNVEGCTSNKACCEKQLDQCDETNLPFDHCVRGYCGAGHASNPDCMQFDSSYGIGARAN